MKKHLDKNLELLSEYNETISNYESEGIIENAGVEEYGEVGKVHYLPHQVVVRSGKTRLWCELYLKIQGWLKVVHPCMDVDKKSLDTSLENVFTVPL